MLGTIFFASLVSFLRTGTVIPTSPRGAFVYETVLLMGVLGSTIDERHFTKPADSLVNALTCLVALIGVYRAVPITLWSLMAAYCAIVFILAVTCLATANKRAVGRWRNVNEVSYRWAVTLGRARLMFSVMLLFSVVTFYGTQSTETLLLVVFWVIWMTLWPKGLIWLLGRFSSNSHIPEVVGRVIRTDWPHIIRAAIEPSCRWEHDSPKVFQQAGGTQVSVIPLYSQLQGDQLVGTGICLQNNPSRIVGLADGEVCDVAKGGVVPLAEIAKELGGDSDSLLVGFVVEDSSIAEIKFETWDVGACSEGMLVWCDIGETRVYYQVTNGITREEAFQANRQGFQIATAAQIGSLDNNKGFIKHLWLPQMNAPVFGEQESFGDDRYLVKDNDFVYGNIPGTCLKVGGPLLDRMDHHIAVLGVTGSGKTEFAFRVIRHAASHGVKVVCIDLTTQYETRLQDLAPKNLSISSGLAAELSEALFDVETGAYGAGSEKKALKKLTQRLRTDIDQRISDFLEDKPSNCGLGLLTLEEISNTQATLHITEMYLTSLLNYARDHHDSCPQVMIVVEEAHTVMPEPNTMGLADFDSKGLVGKIAQIALQGRKYGVGLLVIAQRTATISKSVLTQCNTVISFACIDDTSIGFLSNVYGAAYAAMLPGLPPFHAIIYGKGVRSQRPMVVKVAWDESSASLPVGTGSSDPLNSSASEVEQTSDHD